MALKTGFGQLLKDIREGNKLTQKDLAKKVGCSFQLISAYEMELKTPKIDTLLKIVKALNSEIAYFVPFMTYLHELTTADIVSLTMISKKIDSKFKAAFYDFFKLNNPVPQILDKSKKR